MTPPQAHARQSETSETALEGAEQVMQSRAMGKDRTQGWRAGRALLLALAASLLALTLAGCVHQDELPPDTKLPWSRPATWEGQQIGIPL